MRDTAWNKGRLAFGAAAVGAALALSGCGQGDPLDSGNGSEDGGGTIVVGSQAYYSNQIIAEIYAQALEEAGHDVERRFQIGQRDAYIPALEDGSVELFPEYTGNLLQYYDDTATVTQPDDVYAALQDALPGELVALEMSPATDQDSYTVTQAYADEHSLAEIGDLADVDGEIVLGGPPELEERPYGPDGLREVYDVSVTFEATGDTTFDALVEGVVDVANIFTADPRIETSDLVVLEDPEGLFLASNVVPIANADLAGEIAEVIDPISAALTAEGLVALNVMSVVEERSAADIATDWLTENGFLE